MFKEVRSQKSEVRSRIEDEVTSMKYEVRTLKTKVIKPIVSYCAYCGEKEELGLASLSLSV